jgi:adenosine phosphosulfate reductase beta subunit
MYICPHDLMALDKDGSVTGHAMKAYNQEPEQCWECYSCVKICPQNAIEVRHYADVVPLGASVQPLRGSDSIRLEAPPVFGIQNTKPAESQQCSPVVTALRDPVRGGVRSFGGCGDTPERRRRHSG